MKKLILLLAISLMFGCKKEKQLEPKQTQPAVTTPIMTNLGRVFFYFPSKPSNYKYGNIEVSVNNNGIGKITMMPSGWIPSCNTVGWGIKSVQTIGNYTWKVVVTKSDNNYTKTGTFTITENSCQSINVSQ